MRGNVCVSEVARCRSSAGGSAGVSKRWSSAGFSVDELDQRCEVKLIDASGPADRKLQWLGIEDEEIMKERRWEWTDSLGRDVLVDEHYCGTHLQQNTILQRHEDNIHRRARWWMDTLAAMSTCENATYCSRTPLYVPSLAGSFET